MMMLRSQSSFEQGPRVLGWTRALQNTVITSNSESILQQQFGENPGSDCCYSINFDISTIVWLSVLLQQVSNDDTYWCIILQR